MYLSDGRYRVIGRLGTGGFGEVFLAEDTALNKTWAIKKIPLTLLSEAAEAELSVLTKASHPCIVRITDVFKTGEHIYIVMDHVKGMDLSKLIKSGIKIPEKTLYMWYSELCDAVGYLHAMNPSVIIRDLKPNNIMVRPDGHIILIDFGAATERVGTPEDYVYGTRGYAAPEQLKEGVADERSDIFSLGRVIDYTAVSKRGLGLSFIIGKCTATEPEKRYRNTASLKRDLLLVKNLGKGILVVVCFLVLAIAIAVNTRNKTKEMNDAASAEQAYSQALMCFYDLQNYDDAARYLKEVPEDKYPESSYYTRICEMLASPSADKEEVLKTLDEFQEFNNETVSETGISRYVKNALCIAKTYISYDEEGKGYEKAEEVLNKVLNESDTDKISAGYRSETLRLLANCLISEGRIDGNVKKKKYLEAINRLKELRQIDDENADKDAAASDMVDTALLYTELGEYQKALDTYSEAERDYPESSRLDYKQHILLLMKCKKPISEAEDIWKKAFEAGVTDNEEFAVIRERMDAYDEDS